MNRRTTIILVVVAGSLGLALIASGIMFGLRAYAQRSLPGPPRAFTRPAVIAGSGDFDKSVFLSDPSLGSVTHIILDPVQGARFGIAGTRGALFLTGSGDAQSRVTFSTEVSFAQFVDVEGDGVWEFLNRGGHGWSDASLLDHKGNVLWSYGGMPGVDDLAAGDLDGDGVFDFVVGFNGGGGVRRLDQRGAQMWRRSGANVWHVEVVDGHANRAPEIVHTDAGGAVIVRDPNGSVLRRLRPGPYCSAFSILRWPSRNDTQYIVVAEGDDIWLIDLDGLAVAKLDAPSGGMLGFARGTTVRLRAGEPEYLAVVVAFEHWNASALYLYSAEQALVYHEVITDTCQAISASPRESDDVEDLLVGGTGAIWKYAAKENAGNGIHGAQ